ncbi:MAG: hypothetical protein IJV30_03840 [Oscillospiraceae bacterium]|nr:hypothetical protein [Oscillospiraceae bacterium]
MKREKWNRKTDLRNDPAESVSGAYEPEREYTLEEILSEFSGDRDSSGEQAWENEALLMSDFELDLFDRYESAAKPAAESEADSDLSPAAHIMEEESQITAEAVAPEAILTPEYTADPAEAGPEQTDYESITEEKTEQSDKPEPSGKAEKPEKAQKSGRERKNRRRKQKIVEEFPDMPPEENPAVSGDMDYTALFRMFADPEQAETTASAGAEKTSDDAEREAPSTRPDDPEQAEEKRHAPAETPLFAENSPDFRDILREFMLGDQHPIYADMPGIGKKAGGTPAASDELADLDAAIMSVIPKAAAITQRKERQPEPEPAVEPQHAADGGAGQRKAEAAPAAKGKGKPGRRLNLDLGSRLKSITKPKQKPETASEPAPEKKVREYHVEEDFPTEVPQDEPQPESEPQESSWELLGDLPEAAEQGAEIPDDSDEGEREAEMAEPALTEAAPTGPEEEDAESEEQRGRLKKLLHGFGGSRSARKRALNEPKVYASFEDYVPSEEALAENTKAAEERTSAPDQAGTGDGQEPAPYDSAVPEEDDEILYAGDFPSFGQWILNELMTLWIRLNGIGNRESTATMEDDGEDLGKEVNVANASRYYGSQVTMLRMRFQIGLVLLAILAYLTLGLPVSGMLKTAKVSAAMCLGLQLTIMLLCLDVVTNAAVNLTRRRFGADSLAVLACVISSFDALSVAVGGFGSPHIPLCLFSSLSLMGVLFSSLLSARALRKSIRVPAIGKRVYCVTAEEGVRAKGDLTLLKSVRPSAGFVRRAEETPPDESMFSRSALLQLLAALLLSLLTALIKHSMGDYLYILSAILSCAVPVTALLAFALPFFIGSGRIFSSGAAVAGWSGIHDIGCSRNLIVTDRDLFPEETVSIETVRIFADDSAERVIGFAGSMVAASGSGLAPCFAELMEKNNCRMRQVEDFQWLAGGGLQGRIEGSTVLCGSPDLMQLMNVKVPYRLVDKTTVLLAIDGVLYGIFKINYIGLPEIRTALQELIASNRHPIFAIRDFNITPDLLHEVFDVATDGYDFPPYGDRFRISEAQPSETSKVSAVICREGLGPLTHLADTGRSMYVAIRMNLIVTAAVAVIGMLAVFVKLIGTGEVSAWLPFVLMLLDAIIVSLISLFMRF